METVFFTFNCFNIIVTIYMKKLLDSDWRRAVQFKCSISAKSVTSLCIMCIFILVYYIIFHFVLHNTFLLTVHVYDIAIFCQCCVLITNFSFCDIMF